MQSYAEISAKRLERAGGSFDVRENVAPAKTHYSKLLQRRGFYEARH